MIDIPTPGRFYVKREHPFAEYHRLITEYNNMEYEPVNQFNIQKLEYLKNRIEYLMNEFSFGCNIKLKEYNYTYSFDAKTIVFK